MKIILFIVCLFLGLVVVHLRADQPASNNVYVKSGTWGRCYVKAIPAEHYGEKGITRLYQVNRDADKLVHTYPWYSQGVHLQGNMVRGSEIGISVVRMGPWHEKSMPGPEDMAMEFYFGPRLLKRYATLDISGEKKNFSRSVGHYSVIKEVKGYRWITSNDYAFDIVTADGRTLSFNPVTGERLK